MEVHALWMDGAEVTARAETMGVFACLRVA